MTRPPSQDAGTILLIDDDAALVHTMTWVLSENGFTVRALDDAAGIVEAVAQGVPDVVLLDTGPYQNDPRQSLWHDAIAQLRQHPPTAHVEILVLTASPLGSVTDMALDLDADVLTKPFAIRELLARTRRAVRRSRQAVPATAGDGWDVFISHASEDKEAFVRPLARALSLERLRVWYDEITLVLGDSLRRSIDRGIAGSRFGVVVLSPAFFAKSWPQRELDGLVANELSGTTRILPIWHGLGHADVARFSPTLADRYAIASTRGVSDVVGEILAALGRS